MPQEQARLRNLALRFAEIVDHIGKRLHVGCVMAAGEDWVEVSLPKTADLPPLLKVRFIPAEHYHDVDASWRRDDRIGFTYVDGGPPPEQFAGLPGLLDPRPASRRRG